MIELNIFSLQNPKSPVSEAFRTLRTNIQFSGIDKDIKSMVVTSIGSEEGKTTISINIAVTMAQTDSKVLLVDCDLRKPSLHRYFGIDSLRGLTNILIQNIDYNEILYEFDEIPELHIIGSGPIPPNPAELLGSNKMKNFLENMKDQYDMVILDTPPIGLVTDSALLSTIVDGTVLVCAVGKTDINMAKRSKDLLDRVNANILGVVLNKVPINGGGYYKYHYSKYYYSYYDNPKTKGK
ncbi:MAG: CpsD/CapB family tyrosine-protein kinase [Tissierellia bacterium]|nr:CpsD/CapB family tyrosine-protein kinase [Tissierellia bacterium]